jgi:diadenosine tetraphosphate (Ap4A) HIT family hydrolase
MARIQDDARFPWVILIPRIDALSDIDELAPADITRLTHEILAACSAVRAVAAALGRPAEKLNVAAIGNVVPQLHIHVVARRSDDAAWPAPVWGSGPPAPYAPPVFADAAETAKRALSSALPRS